MLEEIGDQVGQFVYQDMERRCWWGWWGRRAVLSSGWGCNMPGLWGLAAGVLNFIPYFGPTIVMTLSAGGGAWSSSSRWR